MKTAFIIFDRMTMLDFIGLYDPLTRLKSMGFMSEFDWDICGLTNDSIDDKGLRVTATIVGRSLADYDLLIVPGGIGTRTLQYDQGFLDWLRTSETVPLKASVCTGALLLGAAGFLSDKRATTHRNAFNELKPYCREIVDSRVVDEGGIITARGVTSALDLGLYLVERLAGTDARIHIATQMDHISMGHAAVSYIAAVDDFFLIKPEDLVWRPSNLMRVPNADFLERTRSELLGARLWRLPPMSASTLHRHPKAEEFYFVVEGIGRIRVNDQTLTVPCHGGVLVGPQLLRQVFNDTATDVLWLIVGAPEKEFDTGVTQDPKLFYPIDPKQLPKELEGVKWPSN